jgi:formate dehydrogenase subunit gamma
MAFMKSENVEILTRFSLSQRVQHILLIISFSMLALTGLPQSFARMGWAQAWMSLWGGIDGVRKVHHLFATLMAFVFFYHVIEVIGDLIGRRSQRSMLPGKQDLKDAWHAVNYLLGRRPDPPHYGRYDFRQKLEYWALIWGTLLMGATGLVLMFPLFVSGILSGVVVYAAKAAHGLEALLAVASIITWHVYNTHLARGVWPLDTSIFTGKISHERMLDEHPLEYQRLLEPEVVAEEPPKAKRRRSKTENPVLKRRKK